jgi:hypothetical protein
LFGNRVSVDSSSRGHDTMNVGLLLRHIKKLSRRLYCCRESQEDYESFFRRFQFIQQFELRVPS